jgi:nicotinate-nucleotide adenylyltransferase
MAPEKARPDSTRSRPSAALGVLGGTFDPVHNGHLAMAQSALEYFKLGKILLIPTGTLPHALKKSAVSGHDRLAMLKKAVAGNKSFIPLDIEIIRKGKSYTFDTLRILSCIYPEKKLYFIIGSDNLAEIPTWHKYQAILPMITLCVAARPGYPVLVPKQLKTASILTFPSPGWDLSSSLIREQLKAGRSCRYIVSPVVLTYIKKHGLYS